MSPWYMRMMKSLKLTRWSLQPQVHSCSLKSILEIYLLFILRFILIACQQVDTKDLKWILGHNYAPVSATWAIKYAPVYYTGLFWIRGHPTVQTAHCAVARMVLGNLFGKNLLYIRGSRPLPVWFRALFRRCYLGTAQLPKCLGHQFDWGFPYLDQSVSQLPLNKL